MDWTLAISRNRDLLKDIVLGLFLLARMRVGGSLFTLPRSTFQSIMLVLRPAESAVRRLIVIAAEIAGTVHQIPRTVEANRFIRLQELSNLCPIFRIRAFQLFDPLKSFDPDSIWDVDQVNYESGFGLAPHAIGQDTTLDNLPVKASDIGQRLNALMSALNNIPYQARRLARWQAKRDAALQSLRLKRDPGLDPEKSRCMQDWRPRRMSPMRPGLPPGWRQRRIHEIDTVLKECHGLALDLLNAPDTS